MRRFWITKYNIHDLLPDFWLNIQNTIQNGKKKMLLLMIIYIKLQLVNVKISFNNQQKWIPIVILNRKIKSN